MSSLTKTELDDEIEHLRPLAEAEALFTAGAPDRENPFAYNIEKIERLKIESRKIEESEAKERGGAFVADFNEFAKVKGDLADCLKTYGETDEELRALAKQADLVLRRLQRQYHLEPNNDRFCASIELSCAILPSDPIYRIGGPLAPPYASDGWKERLNERVTPEERLLLRSFSEKKKERDEIAARINFSQGQVKQWTTKHPAFADGSSS
jgi:hypothetical protein